MQRTCGPFTVGQRIDTADCGYFSAWAIRSYLSDLQFTEENVLSSRDAFIDQRDDLNPSNYFLSVETLVDFLSSIGLTDYNFYEHRDLPPRYLRSPNSFRHRILRALSRGGSVILLLGGTGSTSGHYIAVLGSRNSGQELCAYDPLLPNRSGWFNATDFANTFCNSCTYLIQK